MNRCEDRHVGKECPWMHTLGLRPLRKDPNEGREQATETGNQLRQGLRVEIQVQRSHHRCMLGTFQTSGRLWS